MALAEDLLSVAKLVYEVLTRISLAPREASPGRVWAVGKISLGVGQFLGSAR